MDLKRSFWAILYVGLCATIAVAQQQDEMSRLEFVIESRFPMPDRGTTLAIARICVPNEEGIMAPLQEAYLVLQDKGYATIEDRVDGHSFKVRFLTGELRGIVALFYLAGGNQYVLKFYKEREGRLIAFQNQPVGSNMHSIVLRGDLIEVSNQIYENDKVGIVVDRFRIRSGDCHKEK